MLVLAFFSGLWSSVALAALGRLDAGGAAAIALMVAALAVPAAVLLRRYPLRFERSSAEGRRIGQTFGIVNGVQWGLIAVASVVLGALHRPELILPAIVGIVGLHFVPLAKLFNARIYYGTAVALVLWACAYPVLLGPGSDGLGALGTGLILWLTGLAVAIRVMPEMR